MYSIANLDEVGGLTIAAADLDGNLRDELASAFQNHSGQIGAISNPFNIAADNDWYWNGSPYSGSISDVNVAAGDLDRNHDNDELAVAFRDNSADPRVFVLDGSPFSSYGAIANPDNGASSVWSDHSGERDTVYHVAVETGDLNGDGSDDEIVVAFRDSGKDLQVVVLRHQNSPVALQEIWSIDFRDAGRDNVAATCSNYWDSRRAIDVTTGDVDGDMQDEAIVAMRIGDCDNGEIQLLLLDVTGEDTATQRLTVDSRVWKNYMGQNYYGQAYNDVSLAAGDMDGDGKDEIALGANTIWVGSDHDDRHWQQILATFEYVPFSADDYPEKCAGEVPGCLYTRPGSWASGSTSFGITTDEYKREAQVNVGTGDLDRDGMAEVAPVVYNTSTGDPDVRSFDADTTSDPPRYVADRHRLQFRLGILAGHGRPGRGQPVCRLHRSVLFQEGCARAVRHPRPAPRSGYGL